MSALMHNNVRKDSLQPITTAPCWEWNLLYVKTVTVLFDIDMVLGKIWSQVNCQPRGYHTLGYVCL